MAIVRYIDDGIEVEVPIGTTLLEAAEKCGAPQGAACGGVAACGTCHLYVLKGMELLSEMDDTESDAIEKAFDVRPNSRLGCQARIAKGGVVEVRITPESRDVWKNEHGA